MLWAIYGMDKIWGNLIPNKCGKRKTSLKMVKSPVETISIRVLGMGSKSATLSDHNCVIDCDFTQINYKYRVSKKISSFVQSSFSS